MKKLAFLFLFIIMNLFQPLFGQNKKIDSLLTLLKTDKKDTNKVILLYTLADKYNKAGEFDKSLLYGTQALSLAQQIHFKSGEAKSYNNIGITYWRRGNFPEALKNQFASLKIRESLHDKKGIANCYSNIGNVYIYEKNFAEALKNQLIALKIYKEIQDKKGIASSFGNLGVIYKRQANNAEALKNYFTALKLFEEIKDNYSVATSYGNIGVIYDDEGNYPEALKMYLACLKMEEEIGNKDGVASCYINIGSLYTKLSKVKEAEVYYKKGIQLSTEVGSKDYLKEAYLGLAILDSTNNNFKAAFEHHKLFILYGDSLNNEETKRKSMQTSMQYEFDKKEITAKAEQDKLDAINREEKQKQRITIFAVAGLLLLVGLFAAFMYNRFRITNRQKVIIEEQKKQVDHAYEELHEKNKEVMDSIHYAKRIQMALITSEKYIANSLNRLIRNN